MKNKFAFVYFLILLQYLPGYSDGNVLPYRYYTAFEEDTVQVNSKCAFYIRFEYNIHDGSIEVENINFPQQSWYELEGIGQTIGMISDTIKYVELISYIKFLQTGSYVINSIIVDFRQNGKLNNILLNSPEINVTDPENEWHFMLSKKLILSSLIFIVLVLVIIQALIRFVQIKNQRSKIKEIASANQLVLIQEELEKLLLVKRFNYKKSLLFLEKICNVLQTKEGIPEFPTIQSKFEVLKKQRFISYKQFENIYQEVYELVQSGLKSKNKGGKLDAGHPKD
ncbi:MAG: hypothetical protein Kow00108_25110 [Calditrichia bacterium]